MLDDDMVYSKLSFPEEDVESGSFKVFEKKLLKFKNEFKHSGLLKINY